MAEGFNRATLLGNLGQDPEFRVTSGGAPCLKMRLATSESYLDKDKVRQERTEWHSIVVWGKRGEGLSKFLTKGMRLFIEGPVRTKSWENQEGKKQYSTEIHANTVIVCSEKRSGGGGGNDEPRGRQQTGGGGGRKTAEPEDDYGFGAQDDDIPF